MEYINKIYSRWEALQMAIESDKIDQENKLALQAIKAEEQNMGILQKVVIYGICTLGVLKYQQSPLAMLGLCSTAAVGSIASNYYLSAKSW